MDDDESLSSILGNDAAPETAPVAAVPAKVETEVKAPVETAARDASGQFAKPAGEAAAQVEVKPAESQKVTEPAKATEPHVAAIMDERRRRQAAEQELERLRQQQTPAARPSVFEDEDTAINLRVQEQLAPLREGLFHQSVRSAKLAHGEGFATAEAAFVEAAEADPQLMARLRASHDPGEFVYAEGLRIKELAEVGGDFGKYREKLTAGHTAALADKDTRINALQAELDALKKTNADLASLPRSLNKSPSGAPNAGEDDDESLSSIVRFKSSGG